MPTLAVIIRVEESRFVLAKLIKWGARAESAHDFPGALLDSPLGDFSKEGFESD